MTSNLKLEQRAYIKIRTLLGIGPKDIIIDLEIVYGDASLSYSTVKEWAKRFREGQESIDDDYRNGRPKSAVTSGNTLEIGWMVEEDPHITVDELAMHVGISTGAAHAILIDELNVTKVCSRWIPHSLTKAQKDRRVMCARKLLSEYQDADPRRLSEIITGDETWIRYNEPQSKEINKVWVLKGERPPVNQLSRFHLQKSRFHLQNPDFRDQKVLYSIFFDAHGPVAQIIIPKGSTITGDFYVNSCLSEVEKHEWERRPKSGTRGLRLLHDNARPHKTKLVKEELDRMRVIELDHPAYSPDLAPCDFWLFAKLKKYLAGKHFQSRIDLGNAVWRSLKAIPPEDYKMYFSNG